MSVQDDIRQMLRGRAEGDDAETRMTNLTSAVRELQDIVKYLAKVIDEMRAEEATPPQP